MDIAKIQQLKRGSLEMVLLSLISKHNCSYGYAILNALDEMGGELFKNTKPGTVYPILYRLKADGFIKENENSVTTSPIKRYEITGKGLEELSRLIEQWQYYIDVIDKLI